MRVQALATQEVGFPWAQKWAGWQRLDEVSGIAAFPGGATKAFGSDFSKMWDIIFICDGCACVLLNGSQACKICIASNKPR